MLHLKAKNLIKPGVIKRWLFKDADIKTGDEIALVEHEDKTTSIITSEYDGVIVKTIKLNTPIKTNSIIANIAVGEKEIEAAKNKFYKKGNGIKVVEDVFVGSEYLSTLPEIGGEVLSKDDTKELGFNDRIALMRSNVNKELKSAAKPVSNISNINESELAKNPNTNLFNKDPRSGVSKFKQLVDARKQKLLTEESFEEKNNEIKVDSMSKRDAKGRPLIMRNIIANRLEKYNEDSESTDFDEYNKSENQKRPNLVKKEDKQFIFEEKNSYNNPALPSKNPQMVVEELHSKKKMSYADKRVETLLNKTERWNILQDRDTSKISARRTAIERGETPTQDLYTAASTINGVKIPEEFLRKSPIRDKVRGGIKYVMYKDTPVGEREFERWLKSTDLYHIYKSMPESEKTFEFEGYKNGVTSTLVEPIEYNDWDSVETDISDKQLTVNDMDQLESTIELIERPIIKAVKAKIRKKILDTERKQLITKIDETISTIDFNDLDNDYIEGDEMSSETERTFSQLKRQNDELKRQLTTKQQEDNISFLKDEINLLKKQLEDKNIISNANKSLAGNSNFGNNSEMFNQMMQYLMFDSMFSLMSNKISDSEMKSTLRGQIDSYRQNMFGKSQNTVQDSTLKQNMEINQNVNTVQQPTPLTISSEVDMTSILKLKHILKKAQNELPFPTISFITKALSISLEKHPTLNSNFNTATGEVKFFPNHNIGLATEVEEGVIVPVIENVEELSIKDLAIKIKKTTQKIRSGDYSDFQDQTSTITLANYGNVGAITSNPTIFYPNIAVIGVGKIVKKPVVINNEDIAIKAIMNISLTFNQTVIDAKEAGRFLTYIKTILEQPELLTVS